MVVTHSQELSLDENLWYDDPTSVHALLQLLLHLSVHGDVTLLVADQQRSENALNVEAALESLSHHAHRCRVDHHFALFAFGVALQST